jgi:predicted mannosyl-3-phosphoglycerate phosphatase (HAD superfamily)
MATKIITKFTIGTEEGSNDLHFITAATAREKFSGKVSDQELENYIELNFNKDKLREELNNLSNQYLIVYVDDEAAGYAKVTSKGVKPEIFGSKTAIRIADFGVLNRFNDAVVIKSLFEKSLSISSMQQMIWISEFENSPYLNFFESYGFNKNANITIPNDLPLQPVYLVKEKA